MADAYERGLSCVTMSKPWGAGGATIGCELMASTPVHTSELHASEQRLSELKQREQSEWQLLHGGATIGGEGLAALSRALVLCANKADLLVRACVSKRFYAFLCVFWRFVVGMKGSEKTHAPRAYACRGYSCVFVRLG